MLTTIAAAIPTANAIAKSRLAQQDKKNQEFNTSASQASHPPMNTMPDNYNKNKSRSPEP